MGFIITQVVVALAVAMGWVCWLLAQRWARRMALPHVLREKALTLGPHGIIIADATQPDLPVVYVNRAFEKITGYSAQEVLGKNCRFLEGTDRDQKGLQEVRRALKEQRDCRVLLRNYRKDGAPFWNDLFVSPVRNDMGRVVQYVAIQQDVTEREQTTRRLATDAAVVRALAESPSLYEAVPRILQAICQAQEWDLGTFWRLDPRTQVLQCVDQWHPADLELQDFENFIRETTVTRDMGVPGYVWARGEQVWLPDLTTDPRFPESALAAQAGLVSACGFPIANRRGLQGVLVFYSRRIWPLSKNLLLLMVGTGAQISQYMEREQGVIEQKELTILERGLAEFMGEGLIAMDREGYCIYVNMTAGRMLGYHPRTLLGQSVHEFLHPAASPAACAPGECPVLLSLQSTRAVYVDDPGAVFRRNDRDPLPVAYTTSPIIHQDLIQGVVITFVDDSARRARDQELRRTLAEKEEEIKRIQQMLSHPREGRKEPSPSDLLIDKIRKLLG
jgi:PAS domain S-box-containing protein